MNRVLMGGPMMGISPIQSIRFRSSRRLIRGYPAAVSPGGKEYPCIGCNSCTNHCPMGLVPTTIVSLVRAGKAMESKDWGLTDCMEAEPVPSFVLPTSRWSSGSVTGKAEYLKEKTSGESRMTERTYSSTWTIASFHLGRRIRWPPSA